MLNGWHQYRGLVSYNWVPTLNTHTSSHVTPRIHGTLLPLLSQLRSEGQLRRPQTSSPSQFWLSYPQAVRHRIRTNQSASLDVTHRVRFHIRRSRCLLQSLQGKMEANSLHLQRVEAFEACDPLLRIRLMVALIQ